MRPEWPGKQNMAVPPLVFIFIFFSTEPGSQTLTDLLYDLRQRSSLGTWYMNEMKRNDKNSPELCSVCNPGQFSQPLRKTLK